jgi:hypothetical protein
VSHEIGRAVRQGPSLTRGEKIRVVLLVRKERERPVSVGLGKAGEDGDPPVHFWSASKLVWRRVWQGSSSYRWSVLSFLDRREEGWLWSQQATSAELSGWLTICKILKFWFLAVSKDWEPSSGRSISFYHTSGIGLGWQSGSARYVSSSNNMVVEEDKSYFGRREELRGAW